MKKNRQEGLKKTETGKALLTKEAERKEFLGKVKKGALNWFTYPQPLVCDKMDEETLEHYKAHLEFIHKLFTEFNNKKRDEFINKTFGELIGGALQDRVIAYGIAISRDAGLKSYITIQEIRHKQDRHLMSIIQAYKNLNRLPVRVVVKQADQVNIGENNNIDKQLNVSRNLDKNHEEIS